MKATIFKVCVAACTLAAVVMPTAGVEAKPKPPPPSLPAPALGETVTKTVPAELTPELAKLAATQGVTPTAEISITGIAPPAEATTAAASTGQATTMAAGAMTCWYGVVKVSWNSLLWVKLDQNWCGDGSFIRYWPGADCWGDSNYPSYAYLGCSTNQTYGLYWNQGRDALHADLCPYWVPGWGSCLSHYYVNRNYYFSAYGAWQQV